MKNREIFGKTFECECGRTHTIAPREVIYAADAMSQLPAACGRASDGRAAMVLMDVRTRAVAGAGASRALAAAGWRVTDVVVPDPRGGGWPVCDDHTFEKILPVLKGVDLVVTVGSGVISDLGKWLSWESKLPFVCFATAASMNGYASSNIAPTLRGVKSLMYARCPEAVLSAPAVLGEAPYEMTVAGLGDVLARSVSSPDWRLNCLLFDEYYCTRAVGLIGDLEPLYLDRPEDIAARRPESIEALFRALLLTGVAMSMADTSFPSSGGEHLISHSLDMLSSVDGAAHDLHGRQVGLGTILACELYRRVLATDSPRWADPPEAVDAPFWGPLAGVVAEHYQQKIERLHIAREKLSRGDTWDRIRDALAPMTRPPERVRDCLARAGGACRAEDVGTDRERLLSVMLHAHEIRSRFTILDLARLTGAMPAAAGEIVEAWA